jgi:hypothetical protein
MIAANAAMFAPLRDRDAFKKLLADFETEPATNPATQP